MFGILVLDYFVFAIVVSEIAALFHKQVLQPHASFAAVATAASADKETA